MGGDTSNTADASKTKNQKAKAKLKHVHNNPGQVQRDMGRFKDIKQKNADLEEKVKNLESQVHTLQMVAEQNKKQWQLTDKEKKNLEAEAAKSAMKIQDSFAFCFVFLHCESAMIQLYSCTVRVL